MPLVDELEPPLCALFTLPLVLFEYTIAPSRSQLASVGSERMLFSDSMLPMFHSMPTTAPPHVYGPPPPPPPPQLFVDDMPPPPKVDDPPCTAHRYAPSQLLHAFLSCSHGSSAHLGKTSFLPRGNTPDGGLTHITASVEVFFFLTHALSWSWSNT